MKNEISKKLKLTRILFYNSYRNYSYNLYVMVEGESGALPPLLIIEGIVWLLINQYLFTRLLRKIYNHFLL